MFYAVKGLTKLLHRPKVERGGRAVQERRKAARVGRQRDRRGDHVPATRRPLDARCSHRRDGEEQGRPHSPSLFHRPVATGSRSLMPPKRNRRSSPGPSGLSVGERLKRAKLTGNAAYSAWGWVGTEVADASGITGDHQLATCGFSGSSTHTLCRNKYAEKRQTPSGDIPSGSSGPADLDEAADDVIVISDDEGPTCSVKACKNNPFCVNYLGQDKWEDVGEPCLSLCVRLISDSERRQSLRGVCESTRPRE